MLSGSMTQLCPLHHFPLWGKAIASVLSSFPMNIS